MNYPERKDIRLKNYDYSRNGRYFITICTADKICYLSDIVPQNVGDAALGIPDNNDIFVSPFIKLTEYGKIVCSNINKINQIYKFVSVEKYVIMPDHIHLILCVDYDESAGGRSGATSPTKSVPQIINGLKTISTKQIGFTIWQRSYYDRIIRSEKEYTEICRYIDNNPINWLNNIFDQNTWR